MSDEQSTSQVLMYIQAPMARFDAQPADPKCCSIYLDYGGNEYIIKAGIWSGYGDWGKWWIRPHYLLGHDRMV